MVRILAVAILLVALAMTAQAAKLQMNNGKLALGNGKLLLINPGGGGTGGAGALTDQNGNVITDGAGVAITTF